MTFRFRGKRKSWNHYFPRKSWLPSYRMMIKLENDLICDYSILCQFVISLLLLDREMPKEKLIKESALGLPCGEVHKPSREV